MSKPTPNYFCVHTGYYRNSKTLALRERIGDKAFYVMPMLWSYAGESQMDGNLSDLSDRRFQEIFEGCHLKLTVPQTKKIIDAIKAVGFITPEGMLHSWDRYNRQFVEFDDRREVRRQAAFARWKQRVEYVEPFKTNGEHQDAPSETTNAGASPVSGTTPAAPAPASSPVRSTSKEVWLIDQALKTAKGPARRKLEQQKQALLSQHTGVDLAAKAPAPAAAAAKPAAPKVSEAEQRRSFARAQLNTAREILKVNPDILTEGMLRALVRSGDKLPEEVYQRHRSLLDRLAAEGGKES